MNKSLLIRSIVVGFVSSVVLFGMATPQTTNADLNNLKVQTNPATLVHDGHLTICKMDKSSYEVVKTLKMVITAYSSTPDQTDDTPFITASGKYVEDGIAANNSLAFGTKFRIPALYGDKVFTVWDRMNKRYNYDRIKVHRADIWFPSRQEAKIFGVKTIEIEVLES